MKKIPSDDDLKNIMGSISIRNDVIDTRIAETLDSIRQGKQENRPYSSPLTRQENKNTKNRSIWKTTAFCVGSAAALFFIIFGIFAANPSLANNIPILGNIFTKVQNIYPFGRMPEEEVVVLYEDNTETEQTEKSTEEAAFLYSAKDNGLTITFTEYYASNQAFFVGVCIESEDAFPKFSNNSDYQFLLVSTTEQYSFDTTPASFHRDIEGRLEDDHTFIGVMRIDYDTINVDTSKYDKAYREAEEKGDDLSTVTAEIMDMYAEHFEIPETFDVTFEIDCIYGYSNEVINEETGNRYIVKGNWEFPSFQIKRSNTDVRTIQIDDVNEQGIGIEMIELSPVELTLHTIEPPDHLMFAVVLDKNGEKLDSSNINIYELAISNHDISTITVYICDYDEYMDITEYAFEDNEKFKNTLEEIALYKKVIQTEPKN